MLQRAYASHASTVPWSSWHVECVPRAGVAFYEPPNPGTGQWCWGGLECPGVPCLRRGACHIMIKPAPPAQAALQLHKFCLITAISISMQLLAVTSLLAPFGSVKSLLVLWICKQAWHKWKCVCCSSRHGHFLLFVLSTEDTKAGKHESVLLSCVLTLFVNAWYHTSQQECASDFCSLLSLRLSLMYTETHKISRWTEIFQSNLWDGYGWIVRNGNIVVFHIFWSCSCR